MNPVHALQGRSIRSAVLINNQGKQMKDKYLTEAIDVRDDDEILVIIKGSGKPEDKHQIVGVMFRGGSIGEYDWDKIDGHIGKDGNISWNNNMMQEDEILEYENEHVCKHGAGREYECNDCIAEGKYVDRRNGDRRNNYNG